MKKIFLILISLILFIGVSQAQTTVDADGVYYYNYTDTLSATGDSLYEGTVYYVDDFAENIMWQINADSLQAGYTKLECVLLGSLDNTNWFSLGTINLAANGADSDKASYTNVFYNYIKPKIRAVDSTQYTDFSWRILIDKN